MRKIKKKTINLIYLYSFLSPLILYQINYIITFKIFYVYFSSIFTLTNNLIFNLFLIYFST